MRTSQLVILWYAGTFILILLLFGAMFVGGFGSLILALAIAVFAGLLIYTLKPHPTANKGWVFFWVVGPFIALAFFLFAAIYNESIKQQRFVTEQGFPKDYWERLEQAAQEMEQKCLFPEPSDELSGAIRKDQIKEYLDCLNNQIENEQRQWAWTPDMTGDGKVTTADITEWIKWGYFYPGDWVIYGWIKWVYFSPDDWVLDEILSKKQLGQRITLTPEHYSGVWSFLISLMFWYGLIGICKNLFGGLSRGRKEALEE